MTTRKPTIPRHVLIRTHQRAVAALNEIPLDEQERRVRWFKQVAVIEKCLNEEGIVLVAGEYKNFKEELC